jgi:hypothetical protein
MPNTAAFLIQTAAASEIRLLCNGNAGLTFTGFGPVLTTTFRMHFDRSEIATSRL